MHGKCTFNNAARNMTAQNAAETGIDNTIQSQAGLSVKISGVAALLCPAIVAHGEIPELCKGLEVLNPHHPHKQHTIHTNSIPSTQPAFLCVLQKL